DLEEAGIPYEDYRSYIDQASAGGYDQKLPIAQRFAEGRWPYDPHLYVDNRIGSLAKERLGRLTGGEEPFLLWASFCGPHPPYDPPPEYLDLEALDDGVEPIPPEGMELSAEDKRHLAELRRRYRAMIRLIDHQVGQLLDTLEASGKSDDTLIVFTADHGEMLGDHGRINKNLYYRSSVSIPMALRGPGIPSGARYSGPVELTDVTGTILDAAGLNPQKALSRVSPARSLLPAARAPGTTTVRDHAFSSLAPGWYMVKDRRHKYVSGPSGDDGRPWQWMIDLENDACEQNDQSNSDDVAQAATSLRDLMLQTLQRHPAPTVNWLPG
ncbi:MAG: sulfatase, partial [Opitutales bacterium]